MRFGVQPPRRSRGAVCAVVASGAVLLLAGCGGGDDEAVTGRTDPRASTTATAQTTEDGDVRSSPRRQVGDAATGLIEAIDARDAAAVCELVASGFLDEVDLPEAAAGATGCREAVAASLGADVRQGGPQWEGTDVETIRSTDVIGNVARVTVAVRHRFADRPNPSVEDDVIYLRQVDGEWRVIQPGATFYRAVGFPEPPLDAYQPPLEGGRPVPD